MDSDSDSDSEDIQKLDTFHLVGCPECNEYIDYTIDAKIDQHYSIIIKDPDSKMKQASITAANQHNDRTGHSASSYKFVLIGPTAAEKEAQKEELRRLKFAILKDIISLAK
jgi:hypothetical protein